MPIRFRCAKCNAKLKSPDEAAGQTINCPICNAAVIIPTSLAAANAPPEDEPDVPYVEEPDVPYVEEAPPPRPPKPKPRPKAPPRLDHAASPLIDLSEALEDPSELTEDPADPFGFQERPSPFLPPAAELRRPCPRCGEMIASSANLCRFCGADFNAPVGRPFPVKRGRKKNRPNIVLTVILGIISGILGVFALFGYLGAVLVYQRGVFPANPDERAGFIFGLFAFPSFILILSITFAGLVVRRLR